MLVVDASLVIAAFFEEKHTAFARRVIEAHQQADILAPALLPWEFANVLWKKRRRSEVSVSEAAAGGAYLESLRLIYPDLISGDRVAELCELAFATDLTAYDAAYLSLALDLSADLATTDKDLMTAAVSAGVTVHSPFA